MQRAENAENAQRSNLDEPDAEPSPLSPEPLRTTRTGEPKETKHRAQRVKEKAYEKTPERFKNASSFQVRLRTGIVYISLNIVCILASNFTTMIILAATAAVCAGEFYYMLRSDAKMPNEAIGVVGAAAFPVAVYFWGMRGIVVVTIGLLLAVTIWYVYWLRARMSDVGVCVFGAFYTGLQLSGLLVIRMSYLELDVANIWGGVLVLVIFASIWFNDAGAYVFGSKFGKHKLAPRTSPNKSWEGFIAGLLVSMAFWCILLVVPGVQISVWQCLLFGLICGLTSVLGDLCESRIKRSVGFKDSGTIMPGHGGLFDRCDSLMPTAVAAALLLFGFGCLPQPI
ncbi:MAG TPA: phosphatidate cytidylyltransferase [Eggerthellaceae bacterium]|nr:phosphatidate cytidylyltransferase [Eggerthellaceae bacterium]